MYDKLELMHQNLVFTSLDYALLKKMSWCETELQKICGIGKQNFKVVILGGQRIDQKRYKGGWRGTRERIEMEAERG